VAVHKVFEAQTFPDFFRFPMLLAIGLFLSSLRNIKRKWVM
jgi:hypothetical protein